MGSTCTTSLTRKCQACFTRALATSSSWSLPRTWWPSSRGSWSARRARSTRWSCQRCTATPSRCSTATRGCTRTPWRGCLSSWPSSPCRPLQLHHCRCNRGHLGGGEGDLLYWLLLWGPKQQDRWFFDEPSGRLSSSYHGLHSCGSDGRLVGDRPKLGDILSTKNMKSISAKRSQNVFR